MSQNHDPRTVIARLVLDEIRESKNGEALAVCIIQNGKKLKIPYANIVCLEQPTPRAVSIRTNRS